MVTHLQAKVGLEIRANRKNAAAVKLPQNGLCAEVNVPTTCSSCDPDLRGVIRPIPRSVSLAPTKASEQFPNRLLSIIENARKILSHLNPVSQAAQHSER